MKLLILMVAVVSMMACTDAGWSKLTSLGSGAHIKCYSGGQIIYEGYSTGKVISEENSDGYFFRDKADDKLKEISGNCVIVYK